MLIVNILTSCLVAHKICIDRKTVSGRGKDFALSREEIFNPNLAMNCVCVSYLFMFVSLISDFSFMILYIRLYQLVSAHFVFLIAGKSRVGELFPGAR